MKFYWKLLTEDGLLKEPRYRQGWSHGIPLNAYSGFESREEALAALEVARQDGAFRGDDMVLIEIH